MIDMARSLCHCNKVEKVTHVVIISGSSFNIGLIFKPEVVMSFEFGFDLDFFFFFNLKIDHVYIC